MEQFVFNPYNPYIPTIPTSLQSPGHNSFAKSFLSDVITLGSSINNRKSPHFFTITDFFRMADIKTFAS